MSETGLDLAWDDAQQAIADSVGAFCRDHCGDDAVRAASGRFPDALWRGAAQLGVLALATPEGDGGALELAAAAETLGAAAFPGPLAATVLAAQLLPPAERAAVVSGRAVVAAGTPPLLPWAPAAQLFVELDGERAWLAEAEGPVEPVATLGGEPWGRVGLRRRASLGPVARARSLAELVLGAYLAAAGRRLVGAAAEHARTRRQFGRAIAEFQAVSHPLAAAAIELDAAAALARVAAWHWEAGEPAAERLAAAARLSAARAAPRAARVAHQVFGASGVTLAGPAFHVSRRIRQLVATPPGDGPARAAVLGSLGLGQ